MNYNFVLVEDLCDLHTGHVVIPPYEQTCPDLSGLEHYVTGTMYYIVFIYIVEPATGLLPPSADAMTCRSVVYQPLVILQRRPLTHCN